MTPSEVAKLLAVVAAAYAGFEVDEVRHRLWTELLSDLDYQTASAAVYRHIATSRFAPTIAEIREQALVVSGREEMTPAEAWGELMAAVRHFGYYREAEALAGLSPETRRIVGLLTWREINLSENLDVLRGQFMRLYQTLQERVNREGRVPEPLRIERLGAAREGAEQIKALAAGIGRAVP